MLKPAAQKSGILSEKIKWLNEDLGLGFGSNYKGVGGMVKGELVSLLLNKAQYVRTHISLAPYF